MNHEWVQQQVDRLIADPAYRIEVAVFNNPMGAAAAYNTYYQGKEALSGQQAAMRLQFLYETNPALALQIARNIPWVAGATLEYDQVYSQLTAEILAQPDVLNDPDTAKGIDLTGLGGLGQGIAALAGAVGMIGAGQRAEDAAEADQARLYLEGQQAAAADAAKAERLKMTLKALGIGAAVIGAIVVLVYLFRRSPAATA